MLPMQQTAKWSKLSNVDDTVLSAASTKDNSALICCESTKYYNDKTDSWIDYKTDGIKMSLAGFWSFAFDFEKKMVYAHDSNNMMNIFDMKANGKLYRYPISVFPEGQWVIIQNEVHVIDVIYGIHRVWNDNKHKFEIKGQLPSSLRATRNDRQQTLIHIPSQNVVFLMGGTFNDCSSNKIYSYCIITNKWNENKMRLPISMHSFGSVVTRNGKFVILFGGLCRGNIIDTIKLNTIYVMDIENMKFGECFIKCPVKQSSFPAVIVNNGKRKNLMVTGFVRDLWKKEEFLNIYYPPIYLQQLIQSYIDMDEIHLFWKYLHWKINVEHILNNTKFD